MSGKDNDTLKLLEVILTAEIFNRHQNLEINDLTPECRELFSGNGAGEVKRPLYVSEGMVRKTLGITDACRKLESNPVVACEEFGQRIYVTTLEPAAKWFLKKGGKNYIETNPALAFFFRDSDSVKISYEEVKEANPLFEDTKVYLQNKMSTIIAGDERLKSALDLVIVNAPEEVEQQFEDLVCTAEQETIIKKVHVARKNLKILQKHRIYEVGKLLFVGPSGTGKTSLALALSHEMHLPIIEVRLSMITSQYLGETSKNIDRIFDFAKKLAPCILFIDEFDFVAKSRVADDHGAMKRAVNSLLKNIDQINLVKNAVLLIGATNHPQLLDEAAWRRFDEVVPFGLPDAPMREEILKRVTTSIDCRCNFNRVADITEKFSGADLRIMVKEAILTALMENREYITEQDLEKGMLVVLTRDSIRQQNWLE
ncbi:MAG TPA: ATP-binding protein [Methanoregulaceae archaeon]|nr:ATP-binding protein [Methanoregulaceae archaeon]